MIKQAEAMAIKEQYGSLTELEKMGVLRPELSIYENKVLKFVNGLSKTGATDFLLYIHGMEESSSMDERDVERLKQNGVDFENKEVMSFTYGLLGKRVNDKSEYSNMARVKAVAWAQKDVNLDEIVSKKDSVIGNSLRDRISHEVTNVERYLGAYFNAVSGLVEDFLPLYVYPGNKIGMEIKKENVSYRSGIIKKILKKRHNSKPINYSSIKIVSESFSYLDVGFLLNSLLNEENLSEEIYQKEIMEEKEVEIREPKFFKGGYKKLIKILKENEGVIRTSEFEITEKGMFSLFYLLNLDFDSNYKISYSLDNNLLRTSVKERIPLEKIENNYGSRLFVFHHFNVNEFSLGEYDKLLFEMKTFSKIPSEINKKITAAFTDLYNPNPLVDLKSIAQRTKEELQEIGHILEEGKKNGLIDSTEKIKALTEGKL